MITLLCTASGFQIESYGLGQEPGEPRRKATLVVQDDSYDKIIEENRQEWRRYYEEEGPQKEPDALDYSPEFSGQILVQGDAALAFDAGYRYTVSITRQEYTKE